MNPFNHSPAPKKRQRTNSSTRLSAAAAADPGHHVAGTLPESSSSCRRNFVSLPPTPGGFNDPSSADVLLRLLSDDGNSLSSFDGELQIHLHSPALCRAKYFSALLSDRWRELDGDRKESKIQKLSLAVPPDSVSVDAHLFVLRLLYADDLSDMILSPAVAISVLPVASKLLFEDLVSHCVRFLEAVPWTEEQEEQIIKLTPFLSCDEATELLSRVSTSAPDSCERMLESLLLSAKHNHPHVAPVKAFVARLMREFSSRESSRRVLEKAFSASLKVIQDNLEEYSSPNFRGADDAEAVQRLNLHAAVTNWKHLMWIVERMIELRVADMAVREWSEQVSLCVDLQRAFIDGYWRNITPGLATVVLKCTLKLATAVAAGTVLVARQVRMNFLKQWLPVLIVCKDNASPMFPSHKPVLHSPKTLYIDLEETFLRIISTLPMDDAQELLQQSLSFSKQDSENCPHLISAFNTWFRRASRPPQTT